MPGRDGQRRGELAVGDVQVGAADAARGHGDDDLARAGGRVGDRLDRHPVDVDDCRLHHLPPQWRFNGTGPPRGLRGGPGPPLAWWATGPPGPPASPGRPSRAATPGSAGRSTANRSSSTRSPNSSRLRTNASGSSRCVCAVAFSVSREPVDDLDRLAVLVDALGVPRPGRPRPAPQRSISPPCSRLCRITGSSHLGIRSELSAHSRATVSRTCGLENRSIELALVGVQVDPRHGVQRRRRLPVHVGEQELGEQRVLAHVVHQPVAREVAEVAQRLVAGVEQPQLHQLVRLDVVDDLRAGVLQRRPPEAELVLEHPLRERLAHHRPLVLDAEPLGQSGAVVVGGDRGDAVDHAVGEPHLLLHPLAELRVPQPGERGEAAAGGVAVALDVVAGQHGERRDAALPTPVERLDDQAERRLRRRARLEVVHARPGRRPRTRR